MVEIRYWYDGDYSTVVGSLLSVISGDGVSADGLAPTLNYFANIGRRCH